MMTWEGLLMALKLVYFYWLLKKFDSETGMLVVGKY